LVFAILSRTTLRESKDKQFTMESNYVTLPVPGMLGAAYIVPSSHELTEAFIREAVSSWVEKSIDKQSQETILRKIEESAPVMDCRLAQDGAPLHIDTFRELGATEEQIATMEEASYRTVIQAFSEPGKAPWHEWIARAIAAAVAKTTSGYMVDDNVQLLSSDEALATLPTPEEPAALANWVMLIDTKVDHRRCLTTRGLARFGRIPELRVYDVPDHLIPRWVNIMAGLAFRLYSEYNLAIRHSPGSTFVDVPTILDVSRSDITAAYAQEHDENDDKKAQVRLVLDIPSSLTEKSFLLVHPPNDFLGSTEEFFTSVCKKLHVEVEGKR
jgi:hypothetical protein